MLGAARAVFCVHELDTPAADADKQAANRANLADFVNAVFGLERPSGEAWLVGPVHARESTDWLSAETELWIGHIRTAERAAGSAT